MSKGNPIDRIPSSVIDELSNQINIPGNHRYPIDESIGYNELRSAIANWYLRRYGLSLDSNDEIAVLLGSKEGILYFLLSKINKGDYVIITDPCYPTYPFLIKLVGGIPYELNISNTNNYLPEFENIPLHILKKTKAFILNYPNNPTGAVASHEFYADLIKFGIKHNIAIVNDNPYIEFVDDKKSKISILELDMAKEVCIELNSFSKIFNMAGWRLGMAVGNRKIISEMVKIKQMVDAGAFLPLQKAAIKALDAGDDYIEELTKKYIYRKNFAVNKLNMMGWDCSFQKGTFYIWLPCRDTNSSIDYSNYLKVNAHILINPGLKYGTSGEGYVRVSLAVTDDDLHEFLLRLANIYR